MENYKLPEHTFSLPGKVDDKIKSYNAIIIPEGVINGEMMKIMFPDLKVEIEGTHITCWIDEHRWFAPDYDWWNAPCNIPRFKTVVLYAIEGEIE